MPDSIENILDKAHLAAVKINQSAARAAVLTQIADAYCKQRNSEKSLTVLSESMKASETLKYPHEKAKSLAAIAAVLAANGQTPKALEQFSRAVLLARAAESPAQAVEALFRIASLYHDSRLGPESLKILAELHKLVVNPENELDAAAELVNIAELYDDLKQKEQAWAILDEALAVAESIPDNWFRLERLIEIADTYSSTRNEDKAMTVLNKAVPLVDKIEEYSRPYFLLRLAEVFIFLCENAQAIEILKIIPTILNAEETAYEKAGGLIEIAEKYIAISQNVPAVEMLVQALKLSESITDVKEKIDIQIEVAGWLNEAEHLEEAKKLAARAYAACQLLSDKKSSIFSLGNLAILYLYLNDVRKAGETVDEIIRIVKETSAKTSGLGAIGEEIVTEGQPELALKLVEIIKEPEVQARLLISVASQTET